MSEPQVLLVDTDTALSERTRVALAGYGCGAELIADPNLVLNWTGQPQLIVLCIDPKRTGWAICNKLKKHPTLRLVPLVITSAEASEKDFDDHRKLRTRAEEYEHKPYPVEQLLAKIAGLLGLSESPSPRFEDDGPPEPAEIPFLMADEIEEPSEDRTRVADADAMMNLMPPEEETSFADLGGDDPAVDPVLVQPPAVSLPAGESFEAPLDFTPPPPNDVLRADGPIVAGDFTFDVVVPPSAGPPLDQLADSGPLVTIDSNALPAPAASGMVAVAEGELSALRDERDVLLREVQELRGRLERSGPVTGSREVMHLREIVNRKEREVFELKEAAEGREREIARARDRVQSVEKRLQETDSSMHALALERDARELQFQAALDEANRELADAASAIAEWRARHDDASVAGERAAADLGARYAQQLADAQSMARTMEAQIHAERESHGRAVAEAEERHTQELLAADRDRQADAERADEALRQAIETADGQKAAALQQAQAEFAEALVQARAEIERLRDEAALAASAAQVEGEQRQVFESIAADKDRALAAAVEEKQRAVAALAAEREQAVAAARREVAVQLATARADMDAERARMHESAESARSEALASLQAELSFEHSQALGAVTEERDAALASLRDDHARALASLRDEHARAVASLRDEHASALAGAAADKAQLLAGAQRQLEEQLRAEGEAAGALRSGLAAAQTRLSALEADLAARDQRLAQLQGENASYQEQIVKAYQRLKADETIVARARKALGIALTLLDDRSDTDKKSA